MTSVVIAAVVLLWLLALAGVVALFTSRGRAQRDRAAWRAQGANAVYNHEEER
jgi:hypothetical protein